MRRAWVAILAGLFVGVGGCTATLDYPDPTRERGGACVDGLDNDLDGLPDALDPGCMSPTGTSCEFGGPEACDSMVCGALTTGAPVCTTRCDGGAACLPGWSCDERSALCTCTPCMERCNTIDDDCDGVIDEETCAVGESCVEGVCNCEGRSLSLSIPRLDLLFVVDNSDSMADEQIALALALVEAVQVLSSGDLDRDRRPEYPPIASLHVGIVSTDMGVGEGDAPNCNELGDDGILRSGSSECMGSLGRIFEFQAGIDDPDEYAYTTSCVSRLGTGGCGFEAQLEAPLKALSPAAATPGMSEDYVAPTFYAGTGHGDGVNAGFLRDDSLLAIVVVTDEEDCSARDTSIFVRDDPRYVSSLNIRCFMHPETVHPVQRYIDGFLQLRRDPESVLFAVIAGVPPDVSGRPFEEILAHPAMVERVMPGSERLEPSCSTDRGVAYPPRRLVEVAEGVVCGGGTASAHSICGPSMLPAFASILEGFYGSDARRACLAR